MPAKHFSEVLARKRKVSKDVMRNYLRFVDNFIKNRSIDIISNVPGPKSVTGSLFSSACLSWDYNAWITYLSSPWFHIPVLDFWFLALGSICRDSNIVLFNNIINLWAKLCSLKNGHRC